jgi:hypothetical protein
LLTRCEAKAAFGEQPSTRFVHETESRSGTTAATMRGIALIVLTSLLGCFPHNHRARTLSKYAEGGTLVAGIGLEFIVNSGADCDQMAGALQSSSGCHTKAAVLGDVGVGMILAGLLGFVATVSTSDEEDQPAPMPAVTQTKKIDSKDLKLPPGVKSPKTASAGSGAAATP